MKGVIIALVAAFAIIGGSVLLATTGGSGAEPSRDNVAVENGTQIIEISAKGGYSPRKTVAKADMPTTLRVQTRGTFDCSSALVVPSVGYREYLPQSGTTDIPLPPQKAGAVVEGLCSMGMYSFSVTFE